MHQIVISGTGLYHPNNILTNEELVEAFNIFVNEFNETNNEAIAAGKVPALSPSSAEFILKASGIKQRYVVDKKGLKDPTRLRPIILDRPNSETSLQAEMAITAAERAMQAANKSAADIDAVIVACSNFQRPYPAIAIEVQSFLGIQGFAFDLNVACSSATFALQVASDMIRCGHARSILVINPEICSAGLNYRDRDSHFIFGDAAIATVLERSTTATSSAQYEILSSKLFTQFSNNIRSNFGYLNTMDLQDTTERQDLLFKQNGRQVFREVVPLAVDWIKNHLLENLFTPHDIKRFWLHQANLNMNTLIMEKLLGDTATAEQAPIILDEFANTASAGSMIAFHRFHKDLNAGDLGVISSFGAGYSIGSLIVRKIN